MSDSKTMPAVRSPYWMAAIGFLVAVVDGYDTLMLAFLAPLIAKEWHLPPQVVGALFASSYAGAAVGATLIGASADRWSRKTMLLMSLGLAGILTALCAGATNVGQLMLLRAIAGLGLGGALATVTAITAEYAPHRQERAFVARMFIGFPIGAVAGGAITAAVMSVVGWRQIFLGGGICAVLLVPAVAAVMRAPTDSTGRNTDRPHSHRPLSELVSGERALTTVLFCASVFLMLLTSYFLVSWIPSVLVASGMAPSQAALAAVVLNCGGIIGTLGLSFVLDRTGPVGPVSACLGVGGILVAILGHTIAPGGVAQFILVGVVGLAIIGAQGVIPALCVYLYPASIHATAAGVSITCGRLGSIVGPLVGGYLVSAKLGWEHLFWLAAVPVLSAAIATAVLSGRGRAAAGGATRLA